MVQKLITSFIRIYQWIFRPLLGNRCRFYPSCSDYVLEAVKTHGTISGLFLGTKRICRCAPWSKGGFDPVPIKHLK